MLKIVRNENGYPIKIIDNDKCFLCCPIDDYVIEMECSFDEACYYLNQECPNGLQFPFTKKGYHYLENKIISLIYITKEKNMIVLEGFTYLYEDVKNSKWSASKLVEGIQKQIKYTNDIISDSVNLGEEPYINFKKELKINCNIKNAITDFIIEVEDIIRNSEFSLGSFCWNDVYYKDEKIFCREVITPLLKRMNFLSVKFNHGANEFGKDYLLSELTQFNNIRYYGVQVKAGNVDGGVNSKVDEIISQINDAFEIPFNDINSCSEQYISVLIIMISGSFTSNAKVKIMNKIPKILIGSIIFIDRENIEDMIRKYWIER